MALKLNMNSMKVAKPMGADALNLLSKLAKKYEDVVEFIPKNVCEIKNNVVLL